MATTALCTLHNNGNYINEGLGRGWEERIQEKSTWKKAKKTVEHPLLFFSIVVIVNGASEASLIG